MRRSGSILVVDDEEIMREIMFDIPSRVDVREVVITAECVTDSIPPLLVLHPEALAKEA